jgi:hypothetical protein
MHSSQIAEYGRLVVGPITQVIVRRFSILERVREHERQHGVDDGGILG